MAIPPEHTRFKKGISGNPGGKPKGIVSLDQIKGLMGRLWKMDRNEMQALILNPRATMGEIAIASVLAKAAKDGDYARLSFLLDRMIGRVPQMSIEATTDIDAMRMLSTDELIDIVKKKIPELAGVKLPEETDID